MEGFRAPNLWWERLGPVDNLSLIDNNLGFRVGAACIRVAEVLSELLAAQAAAPRLGWCWNDDHHGTAGLEGVFGSGVSTNNTTNTFWTIIITHASLLQLCQPAGGA